MPDQPLSSFSPQNNLLKVVSIVGPTATGKTELALKLASSVLSENREIPWKGVFIISVDSRQVYKGLEICSGADVPSDWHESELSSNFGYQHPTLPIFSFGLSCIAPDQDWSVSHFRKLALPLLMTALNERYLVILVGGTGLYHDQLFSADPALDVPPNPEIRDKAQLLPLVELQNWVKSEDFSQWTELNESDRQNPRRLVRVIEKRLINQSNNQEELLSNSALRLLNMKISYSGIGITAPIKLISSKVRLRVEERLKLGAIAEVQGLLSQFGEKKDLPAFSTTGCKEILLYLEEKLSYDQLVGLWTTREVKYAKRQLTWWKAHQQIVSTALFHKHTADWYDLGSFADPVDLQTVAISSCILGL